jgi:hypothetical protein
MTTMNRIADFIDRHIYGIIAAVAAYVIIFVYLNLETYTEYVPIGSFFDGARVEIPQDIEVKPENIEIPSDYVPRDVKSIGRNVDDKRERSKTDWKENKMSASDVEKSVKEYERKLFEEAGGEAQRKKIQQEMDERKKDQKQNASQKQNETSSTTGGNKAFSGDVMVEWDLRAAHQNNSWYVRNPGYTCGYGSSGKVIVRIKVDQNGDVKAAEYDASSSRGANPCMIEQALKYAKMSRFIYSSSAPKLQDGWISYTFRSQ